MPALINKSITRSLSKKWNSVRGGKNKICVDEALVLPQQNKNEDNRCRQILNGNFDGYGYSLPAPPNLAEDLETPSPYYEKPPEMVVVSDTSSDDDSSKDEKHSAKKYGYGDASPDFDDVATKLPQRLSSRRNSVCQRRRSSIRCSGDDSSEVEKDVAKKYGYGDGAPDCETNVATKLPQRLSSRRNSVCQQRRNSIRCSDHDSPEDEKDAAEKYGYGDAAPDYETNVATKLPRRLSSRRHSVYQQRRSSIRCSNDNSSEDEKDAAEKYGYGDAAPDYETNVATKLPRQSSSRRNSVRQRRRSLIRRQQPLTLTEENDDKNLSFHPQRMPRRSSLKGSCPQRAARRRASIGTCTIGSISALNERRMSIEEEIVLGVLEPSQILEVTLPGRRESIKRRRSIQFNEDVNVCNIQPTSKINGAIKKELWFQDDEYIAIKKKTRALLQQVDSNGIINGKKFCTRGLEKYMECPKKRNSEICQAWDLVLTEQEMQRKLNIYDGESLGRFYKQTSNMSVLEATNRAILDAKEVASFYQSQQPKEQHTEPQRQGSDGSASSRRRRVRRASIA